MKVYMNGRLFSRAGSMRRRRNEALAADVSRALVKVNDIGYALSKSIRDASDLWESTFGTIDPKIRQALRDVRLAQGKLILLMARELNDLEEFPQD